MLRVLARNITSNWLGFAVQAAIVFFLTPFVLRNLGDARYGIWVLTLSITGSYGILAFGFQGATTQFLARHIASNDYEQMNNSFSTGVNILSYVAALFVVISVVMFWLAPVVFQISQQLKTEMSWCILIVGCSAAVQMALFPFSAVLVATQRFDLLNLVGIIAALLRAILIWFVLSVGLGLVAMLLATAVCEISGFLAKWRIAYRVLPELKVPTRGIHTESFWELSSFGVWVFLISMAQSIFVQVDALVIGLFMPVAALAPYSLASSLCIRIENLLQPITKVFNPAVVTLHTQGRIPELRAIYLCGSRLYLVFGVVVAVVAAVWAESFYRLWIGQKYLDGNQYTSVAVLFHLLLLALAARSMTGLGHPLLSGSFFVRPVAFALLAEAACNLFLSIVFVQYIGLVGVAAGTVVSSILFRTFIVPYLVMRHMQISMNDYFFNACLRPVVLGAAFFVVSLEILNLWTPRNFVEFFVQMSIALLCATPLVLFVGLNSNDRTRFLYIPLKSIVVSRFESQT